MLDVGVRLLENIELPSVEFGVSIEFAMELVITLEEWGIAVVVDDGWEGEKIEGLEIWLCKAIVLLEVMTGM